MSLKEILVVFSSTLFLLAFVIGGMVFALVYLDTDTEVSSNARIECAEENLAGLCNLRYYYEKSKKSAVHLSI